MSRNVEVRVNITEGEESVLKFAVLPCGLVTVSNKKVFPCELKILSQFVDLAESINKESRKKGNTAG